MHPKILCGGGRALENQVSTYHLKKRFCRGCRSASKSEMYYSLFLTWKQEKTGAAVIAAGNLCDDLQHIAGIITIWSAQTIKSLNVSVSDCLVAHGHTGVQEIDDDAHE